MPTIVYWAVCYAAFAMTVACQSISYGSQLRTVAFSGSDASEAGTGVTFSSFGFPTLNNQGKVAFRSSLSDFTSSIWSEGGSGASRLIAKTGDPATGLVGGGSFVSLHDPVINNTGQTAFYDSNGGFNVQGLWVSDNGAGYSLVAGLGGAVPGLPSGVTFNNIRTGTATNSLTPLLADNGNVLFRGEIIGPGIDGTNNSGLWGGDALGGIDLIVRRGDEAIGQDIRFGYPTAGFESSHHPATINNQGDVAFVNLLTGVGVGPSDHSLWSYKKNGGLSLVAREDDVVSGLTGVTYHGFGSPILNSDGDLAFYGSVKGNVTTSASLQRKMEGQGVEVVVNGEANAPGTGATFRYFWSSRSLGSALNTNPIMNQEGHLAFTGYLNRDESVGTAGTNDSGIWSEGGDGVLRLVAREGDPAPGTAMAFPDFHFWAVVLNGNGQTAFMGDIVTGTQVCGPKTCKATCS